MGFECFHCLIRLLLLLGVWCDVLRVLLTGPSLKGLCNIQFHRMCVLNILLYCIPVRFSLPFCCLSNIKLIV